MAAQASMRRSKWTTASAVIGGLGTSFRVALVTVASVPSLPATSWLRLKRSIWVESQNSER